ncbi:MAG: LLM class flavin-dependent oxidoreductase [Chloroflexi bacterium]|nr:MAG: LLM class flavin-dependent oxidoreductase [Chloroflexota bacterium]
MKLGLTVPYTDDVARESTRAFVQAADRLGYDKIWVAEAYGWDAFTVLTEMACQTERIQLATGIAGHQVVAGWHGVPFERGVRRMRETMEIVRTVLRRDRLAYEGEVFRLDMGLKLITHPVRDRIPIYLATLTPSGLALAGELADGWLPVFFSPGHFEAVLRPQLERGAQRSGRSLDELSICVSQPVVVTDDVDAGRDSVRPQLALYIGGMGSRERNYYNQLFRRYGFEAEAERIQDLYLSRRREEAMAAITTEMIDLVTGLRVPGGGPDAVLEALEALAPERAAA